tara:strand:- start:12056 stop:12796 length:741 start_codon:yes stop_codon:yes gene_type:complete
MFHFIKSAINNFLGRSKDNNDIFKYREHLFDDLVNLYPNKFKDKRILEIGPRDGLDTFRLQTLKPEEIVIMDLKNRTKENKEWLKELTTEYQYIEANFMYLTEQEYKDIGKFDLIWFTGVIYHNPEQLRFLFKLYNQLNINGVLILESSTIRQRLLRNKNVVQIFYPETFRKTETISHLPSRLAIKSWLGMVGFDKIIDSKCFEKDNSNLKNIRYACIAEKTNEGNPKTYYTKQFGEQSFIIGGSS